MKPFVRTWWALAIVSVLLWVAYGWSRDAVLAFHASVATGAWWVITLSSSRYQ